MPRAAFAAALTLVAAASPAWAQDAPSAPGPKTLSGAWSASGLSERWTFPSWGEACGPKPRGAGGGGGAVTVREQGSELAILGGGRAWSTAECWEQMPGLARTRHSASGSGRVWTTRCSSPANDPRHATVVTRVSATDDSISMSETGNYEFVVNATKCTASVVRSRSYSIVRRDGEEPPAASASASAPEAPSAPVAETAAPVKPAPKPCAGGAGEPARLDVSPAKKLLRAGDSFTFRVAVVDEAGCALASRPTWSLKDTAKAGEAAVEPSGTVRVKDGAAPGQFEVVASLGGKDAVVTVEVISKEAYDALLATDAPGDALESGDVSVAIVATGTLGGRANEAQDSSAARKRTFIAVVAGVAALVGFVGLVLLRRGRRGELEAAADEGDRASALPPESRASVAADEDGATADETPAAGAISGASEAGARATAVSTAATRRGDAKAPEAKPLAKICPVCGAPYAGAALYCGKDGATLVPVNG